MLKQRVHRGGQGTGTRRGVTLRRVVVAAAAAVVVAAAWAVPAGTEFTYQGRLKKNGNLVTGLTDFRFSLWDDPVAGNQIGPTLEFSNEPAAVGPPVQVTRGLFKVELDFGLGAFDGSERWLQIEVRHPSGDPSGFALLSQRQKVTATPYAIVAIGQSRLAASDGDPADALVVDAAGNVGIGTATPSGPLTVESALNINGDPQTNLANKIAPVVVSEPGTPLGILIDSNQIEQAGANNALYLNFNSPAKTLINIGGGNVGIGTLDPQAKLDVNGATNLRGGVEVIAENAFIDFHAQSQPGDFTMRLIQAQPSFPLELWGQRNPFNPDPALPAARFQIYGDLMLAPPDGGESTVVQRDPASGRLRIVNQGLSAEGPIHGPNIELSDVIPFIDFHAAQDPSDFTARIAQYGTDQPLRVQGPGLAVDGNVGVGTTVPEARLDVRSGAPSAPAIVFGDPFGVGKLVAGSNGVVVQTQNGQDAIFVRQSDAAIGIGTDSPRTPLEVVGDITATNLQLRSPDPFIDFYTGSNPPNITARIIQWTATSPLQVVGPGLAVDGSMGVGTSAPEANIHVRPTGGTPAARAEIRVDMTSEGDGSPNSLILAADGSFTQGMAIIDTAHQGVAAATPLSIRAEGVEAIRVDPSGQVGINKPDPGWTLDVAGSFHAHGISVIGPPVQPPFEPRIEIAPDRIWWFAGGQSASFVLINPNGTLRLENANLRVNGNISASGSCCSSSDIRFKKDIRPLRGGLEVADRLSPVRFSWRTDQFPDRNFSDEPQIGFIAQEVLKVLPELVTQDEDGYYAMDYGRLTAVLTAAVQELHRMFDAQAERVGQAEQRIEALEAANAELKAANQALRQRLDDQQAQLDALKRQLAELRAMVLGQGESADSAVRESGRH